MRGPLKSIESKRQFIYDFATQHLDPQFKKSRPDKAFLDTMICAYDRLFFGDKLMSAIDQWCSRGYTFVTGTQVSKELLKDEIAGVAYIEGMEIGLKLDSAFVANMDTRAMPTVGCIPCNEHLRCWSLLLEHELVHLWCYINDLDRVLNEGVHGPYFEQTLKRFFGQTSVFHEIASLCSSGHCE